MASESLLINEPSGPSKATLVLAHGAGAGMDSHPLKFFAESLTAQNIRVVRFEFPYMRLRRVAPGAVSAGEKGLRKPPDPPAVLLQSWREVIAQLREGVRRENPFIGGKSMGGRIASMIADEAGVRGLVCLGYPFHPSGKPRQLRIAHLKALKTPALILQGERDPFGSPAEVAGYELSPGIRIAWIPDGEHSFKPRKQSGITERQNLAAAVSHIVRFLSSLRR